MKKIFLPIYWLGILFFFQSCNKIVQDETVSLKSQLQNILSNDIQYSNYYWSGKKKINLSIDSSAMIFLPKDSIILNRIRQGNPNAILKKLSSGYYFIETKNVSKEVKTDISTNTNNSEFVYKTDGNYRLIQTGEILLKPKTGITIEKILKVIPALLSITRNTVYNTYILKVENKINILAISNAIYENGDVEYCHPNFIANISVTTNDALVPIQY